MRSALLFVALTSVLVAPAAASASTVTQDGRFLRITAGPGETNDIWVHQEGYSRITDSAGITAGAGCEQVDATTARCDTYDGSIVKLGDGNDEFTDQGAGKNDIVEGEAGNDDISAGSGNDAADGGDGNDTVRGHAGEDELYGGRGDDKVLGQGNDDTLHGGPGQDSLAGDQVEAFGDDGNDRIDANDGEKDLISCDGGADSVQADSLDVADSSCDDVTVNQGSGPDPDPAPDAGPLEVSVDMPASLKLKRFLKNGLAFRATFNGPAIFAGGLFVTKKTAKKFGLGNKTTVIASGGGAIDEAGTYNARLTDLSKKKKLRALLERKDFKSLPVVFEALAQNEDGDEVTVRKKLKLTR